MKEINYIWNLKDTIFTKDKGKVFSCFACGGGSNKGRTYPDSWKLSKEKLEQARKDFDNGTTLKELAKKYNVCSAYFYPHGFRR